MSPRLRCLLAGFVVAFASATTVVPAGAQEDTTTSTTSTPAAETTTTTSSPTIPDSTSSTTAPPDDGQTEDTSTTSTTVFDPDRPVEPGEDPVADEDATPPEEVPTSDETVPPPPGEPVDGAVAERVIRRELTVARADAVQSEEEVATASQLVDDLSDRLARLQRELARLDVAHELAVKQLEDAQQRFEQRIANAVVRGNAGELETVFSSEDANQVETRKIFLQSVSEADNEAVADYRAAKEVIDRGLLEAVESVARTRRELRDARARLQEALRVNAERKFQLAVFAAGSEIVIRGFVFPVGEPYTFGDSWGYPRMVGTEYEHGHQGVDIMAPFGTPLYAVERGIIIRVGVDVLGGTKLWLKGQSGTYYYYAHLSAYVEGVGEGTLVEAGDVIGFVGDTGNAKGGAPHLHFQVHPGGGEPANPYGLLRVVADLSRR